MTETQKDFLMHLAIVIISAVLSFLLSYIQPMLTPVDHAIIGGGSATILTTLKATLKTLC